jgi:ribulose-5-phosphate 4-epimerase/fuculose-1-phosphate aldolase
MRATPMPTRRRRDGCIILVLGILAAAPALGQGAKVAPSGAAAHATDPAQVADLVAANRILADHGVLDAFGHVSVRSSQDPSRFLQARSGAPALVTEADIIEFDLDAKPIDPGDKSVPLERFIHSEIYRARPDVKAIVHSHAPSVIPFGITAEKLRPVYHMGSFLGDGAPVFEIRDGAGAATDLLIRTPAIGAALARSLGNAAVVLLRGHGDAVVGASLPEAVFRAIYTAQNADLEAAALRLGTVNFLTPEEAKAATETNAVALNKAWLLWKQQASARR